MKRVLSILIFFFSILHCYSQENVFILVDVSKSGAKKLKEKGGEGEKLIKSIITGSYSKNNYSNWQLLDPNIIDDKVKKIFEGQPVSLIGSNSVIGIIEIGDYQRHLNNKVFSRVNSPTEFSEFFDTNYPINTWKDQTSFILLPQAWLASFLKTQNLSYYYIFLLTDNDQDKGSQSSYTLADKKLIAEYGTGNLAIEKVFTINNSSLGEMNLTLLKINLSKLNITPNQSGITLPPASSYSLQITSPKGGTIKTPVTGNKNQLITWSCNCPDTSTYLVRITGVSGNKYRPNPNLATTSSRSYSFSGLGGGDYRVTVSLKNEGATANTVFSVPGDGGSGILWVLLLILAAGAIGYWFWNKKRQKKLDDNKINKPEDLFSAGGSSGATGASGQGNSGYF